MIKEFFIIASLAALLLSACGPSVPVETDPPAVIQTETRLPPATEETSTATETPAELPTATATLETPVPTNVSNCTNSASFVTDATIPDNSPVSAGTIFTKTWTIKNTGTCIWGPDYKLVHYSEEFLGAPSSVPLPVTFPGETVDLSVTLAAPDNIGPHRANFVINNPAGLIMRIDNDSRLWVIITVTDAVAANTASVPVTGGSPAAPTSANAACAFTLDAAKVAETINAINAYRAQNGLAAYLVNDQLLQAAQAHANDAACNKLFVHTGSNGSTPQTRVAASGYLASSVAENVYGSYPPLSGQGAVNWWINDKTDIRHNQNLISTKYTELGVGYSFYNNYGFYVLVFAAP